MHKKFPLPRCYLIHYWWLLQAALRAVRAVLADTQVAKPFASQVTERIAPGYFEVVKRPMDLGSIRTRLESKADYSSPEELRADIAQVGNT